MRIQNPTVMKLGGMAIASVTRHWMCTLEYKAVYYDRRVDPTVREFGGPAIFLFWHEYIPFLFYLRGHCNLAMLLSRHQDAEWLSQASRHMGFQTVRGSTNRGGVAALRELLRRSRSMNLAITPDGPRGPRRRLAQGCVFVSSKLGIPLVPIGLGYDRPWRNRRAWDHFAIPRPGSRARAVAGPFVQIPANLSRDGYEHYRQRVERLLNRLTETAEQWAESGSRYLDEVVVRREGAPLGGYTSVGRSLESPPADVDLEAA
jgi:lysophospholipid acyltransferase (LPLAT)-like uncharacterized protein